MSLGVPGNSVTINMLMRWPILVPAAVVGGGVALTLPEDVPPVQPPAIVQVVPVPQPEPLVELPIEEPVPIPLPPAKKNNG